MADKFRLELNSKGVRELLRSEEIKAVCKERASAICSRLGDGYEISTYTGKTRVNAAISSTTYEAYKDNLENNTVLKALK